MATFSKDDLARVEIGQDALVRIFSSGDQPPIVVPGVVYDVPSGGQEAEILIMTPDLPETGVPENTTGLVEVEVERLTPLALVLRTSGKYLSGNQIPVSPQTGESTQSK
jgi:hypothetical protein